MRCYFLNIAILLLPLAALVARETVPQNPLSEQTTATPEQSQKHDCTLQGTVVSTIGGGPIRKATVHLIANNEVGLEEQETTITDVDGRFSFSEIPSGHYQLLVSHTGYVNSLRHRDPALSYTLAPGQEIKDVVVRLTPAAVVRGRVVDEDGDPVSQVQVNAITAGKSGGPYARNDLQMAGSAITDDQGNFRIFGMAPGHYYVEAGARNDFSNGAAISKKAQSEYVETYYPGTTSRENATALDLHGGDEIAVNIALQRANVYPVSGMFMDAKGAPVQFGMVTVMQGMQSFSRSSPVMAGKFELHVAPGRYVLIGAAADQAGGGKFVVDSGTGMGVGVSPSEARKRISVPEGGLRNVVLSLTSEHASRVQVSGSVRGEDGASLPKTANLFVSLAPMDAENSEETDEEDEPNPFNRHDSGGFAFIQPDRTFQIENVSDGTYLLQVGANTRDMEDWYTKSVLLAGHDVLNNGIPVSDTNLQLDVVLSPKGGTFEGSVKDKDDKPVTTSTVVIVPDAERAKRHDLYQTAATDQNGHFIMRGLEPGSYTAYAFDDEQPQLWFSSEAMKRYKDDGVAITINAAEKAHAELHLVKAGQEQEKQ